MFCPTCQSEYQPGITRCPDDDTELVESLVGADVPDDSEANFVTLHTLSSPAEAEMVTDILRQNDIRAVVQAGANDAFAPVFSAVSPGVAVLVDERDLDRAKEIYASFFGEDTSPLTGPADEGEDTPEAE
jgi:Putative prokaryotic signal transducing protein